MKKDIIRNAAIDTIPVLAGYLVLGFGFGIIMSSYGYGIEWSVPMSIVMYGGTTQYAAAGFFAAGASLFEVALTMLIINARHIFYGITMIDTYKNTGLIKPYLMFSLTDETYSLVCIGNRSKLYCIVVSVLDHIYWIMGTALGSLVGGAVKFNSKGIDFVLTALFIVIFTDQWLNSKNHLPALTGVVASALSLVIFGPENFLIPAMIMIAVLLLLQMKKEEKQ